MDNTNNISDVLSDQPINNIEERNDVLNTDENNNILNNQNIVEQEDNNLGNNAENNAEVKKILGLNVSSWGLVSAIANFLSVVFQLYKTVKTEKVKSFSIKFIGLMTFLNFVYFILGILTENYGMTFACLVFVIYNLIIVYYYYFGQS